MASGVQGDGDVETVRVDAQPFTELEVGHAFIVHLKEGDTDGVEIRADKNLQPLIEVRNEGSVLKIEAKENLRPTKPIELTLFTGTISRIVAGGASRVEAQGFEKPERVRLVASGASRVVYNGAIDGLEAEASGASAVVAKDIVGGKVEAQASGSSGIELAGKADEAALSASGASGIQADGLVVASARAEASGASQCVIDAVEHLDAHANGASQINYIQDPARLDKQVSGASKVVRK